MDVTMSNVHQMTRKELLAHRKAQLKARQGKPGYETNVIALQDEIDNLEQLKDTDNGK